LERKSNFGYKFLFFILLIVAIANAAAGRFHAYYEDEAPEPDSPKAGTPKAPDSSRNLKFRIYDHSGEPLSDHNPSSIDLKDPPNIKKTVEYDPEERRYNFNEKLGDEFLRNPTYLTYDEYVKYKGEQDEMAYWQRRIDALSLFNKKPELPQMYKEGLFDRIFGNNSINVKPQGNVDVTFGGNWQNIKNPILVQRAQKYGIFDFDMQMNINLLATVGDKLKLNINNNTKATFDYQNTQKLEYTGKEDEIIKKIEAGNISFPLKSNLISGVQSLFGIKTQLQFGKLWVTGVLSQQKSQRKSLTVQGGAQTQQFAIKADNYEENRDFLLAQYFHDNYNNALKDFPLINSQVTINRIEVWVTNRTGAVTGVRDVLCFMDLGEKNPYLKTLSDPNGSVLPDNRSNQLYNDLLRFPNGRQQNSATNSAVALGLTQSQDFERTTARKLNPSEFSFNAQLGFILLNTQLNSDDVLGVAYRYTYKGKVFQVGEFAEDLPPDSTSPKVMYLKMLKGTAAHPGLPIWNLMMKNIYALGGLSVSKDNFILNIMYQDPGGGEKRYLPEGPNAGIPLISLLNLDRLNAQGEPHPDGVFDFVEGITINSQQGKVIFPVLQPFGNDLAPALGSDATLQRKYLYNVLYDSTKTVALQFQQNDRYIMRGSYKSSTSSEIFLGGFNIPPGSVTVSAGGQRLVENQDYQIDYGLGRLKILNTGILSSGVPINVQYEDNSTFGFQVQNFMATRFDYYVNKKLTLGATWMHLAERPFTQKVNFGDDPIKNVVLGADANYQSEFPALTKALDRLPLYATTAPSFVNASGEIATMIPGHATQINALDPEGSVYIDDFEGTTSAYDMKMPAISWSLSSTPYGAVNRFGQTLFPESQADDQLTNGMNRARLAWYFIEPSLVDGTNGVPDYVKNDSNQHYIRMVQIQDIFPQQSVTTFSSQSTLDLGYYPKDKGPYNFDATNIDANNRLLNPETRWGGIQRPIDNTDFEASNVEYIQFWLMDPFINNPTSQGGSLYFNLGNVSEDVLKDSRLFFENGIPYPFDRSQVDTTIWGYVPRFSQQITRAFNNDPNARTAQDVGYDGLNDTGEQRNYAKYLATLQTKLNPSAYQDVFNDPSNDNYHYYRGSDYDNENLGVLGRYKKYNNPQGNSPISDPNATYSSAATTIPESEDINHDNTLNEAESYYQYRIDLAPNMTVGSNNIINKVVANPRLPNGNTENETWYQFKIPIRNYDHKVGGIGDFRSIRFIRMFLAGFHDSAILRFATLELGRNQWRSYLYSLEAPGENIPQQNSTTTSFSVTSVSLEENSARQPIPYVMPPGVNRQQASVSNGQTIALNEQSISLKICPLQDGDARAVFKEVNVDMRQFTYLRMFIHAESEVGQSTVNDGDLRGFIRIGSDFTNNYYEYEIPLKITVPYSTDALSIWPLQNEVNLTLQDLVNAKLERDSKQVSALIPYATKDSKGNTILVVGNPNIGNAKNIMLGVLNPKKSSTTPGDDGLPKCAEVWFNELRMAGFNDQAGYAAAGKVALQLADLGNLNFSGSMHTPGYGNIDQKIQQRFQDNFRQYSVSTNLGLGKLLPRAWGVQLPMFLGYTQNVSTPKYDPYNQDVTLSDELNSAKSAAFKDSLQKAAQDFTSITSINFTNVRILGSPDKQNTPKLPWSIRNFDFTYSYTDQKKHNPTLSSDELNTQRFSMGYTYSMKAKPFEPFKRRIKSKSKWFMPIKDFNINPLPSNFTFRTDLNRMSEATQVRNLDTGSYQIPTTYYKNFTWIRQYTFRWELTRSLSFDYTATNTARVDEPYGLLDTKAKKDSLYNNLLNFGHTTLFTQTFNSAYNVPLQKFPFTDFMTCRLGYTTTYNWTGAPPVAYALGNTIENKQTQTLAGEINWTQLYNKNKYLKALTIKPSNKNKPASLSNKDGSKNAQDKNTKDAKDGKDNNKPGADNSKGGGGASGGSNGGSSEDQPVVRKHKKKSIEDTIIINNIRIVTANLSDDQLDSVVQLQKAQDAARLKALKEKEKQERKLARKLRRKQMPELTPTERFIGKLLTMVSRSTINITQNAGTTLPGYLDSTRLLGVNTATGAPGFNFVYGYQPTQSWLNQQAINGKITHDSIFNSLFLQNFSQNINATTTLTPFNDFRIELSLTRSFSKTHSEMFKDTGGVFGHLNPYETGSFSQSYLSINTMFQQSGINTAIYNQFLNNRYIISRRLGLSNPYTNGLLDPSNPQYMKGYTEYSQEVLIPSFIAAYTGVNAGGVALLDDNNHNNIRANPFKYYFPTPNWRLTYNGLSKLPFFSSIFNNFVVNHAYSGTMSMNGFNSSLLYQDMYGMGYPSFIDSISHNYVPFFQVPNVTISQSFSPLIGVDMAFKNFMTAKFEVRMSKTESLSLVDYQVSENRSTEYVVGFGFRKKGVRLPFPVAGIRKLKNELTIKVDVGLRDDKNSNNFLSSNIGITSSGQTVLRISPSVDYMVNQRLTLHIFYSRQQTIPYVSSSYPITTTQAGITLRFIFAQ
jgi:cell surface protein SprA